MIQSRPIVIWEGRDNVVKWALKSAEFIQSPRGITRCVMIFKKDDYADVIIDSDVVPLGFDFSTSDAVNGVQTNDLSWKPGIAVSGALPAGGIWKVYVYVYDAVHVNGIYYGTVKVDVKHIVSSVPSATITFANNFYSYDFNAGESIPSYAYDRSGNSNGSFDGDLNAMISGASGLTLRGFNYERYFSPPRVGILISGTTAPGQNAFTSASFVDSSSNTLVFTASAADVFEQYVSDNASAWFFNIPTDGMGNLLWDIQPDVAYAITFT